MRRIRIDRSDKHRVLLTDMLPYETPLFFSNEGFYWFCKERLVESAPVVRTILTGFQTGETQNPQKLNTVPYGYDIRKGTLETRTLSLFHPAVQLQIVSLYERFSHVILHLCGRSKFSLRHPAAVASAIYGKEEDDTDDGDDSRYGATFFKYEKYDLLYRFFDSYEFMRLEKRFRHLRMFDISKCFNHIYTHTLSWAVRSKEFAKKHLRSSTFDGDFDAIMQAANHKETAGILIGPEVSRIFAEIILQKVDAVVERRLSEEMKCGLDYDVRRYVDDYYVFSSKHDIGEKVMRAYHEELKQYRLYFNEAKSVKMVVPFMTPISCAKVAISSILSTFFDSIVTKEQNAEGAEGTTTRLRGLWNPDRKANRLIQRIKSVVMSHDVEFASISGFLFAVIEKRVRATLKALAPDCTSDRKLGQFLFAVLDATFFIYAMDVRVSTTYKVGRIAIEACKAVDGRSIETNELIRKKIYDESRRILVAEIRGHPELYVETVNLLAVIRVLGPEYRVASETIDKMIETMDRERPDGNVAGVDYFLFTAILFHVGDDPYYADQKAELLRRAMKLFDDAEDPSQRADFTCLFLDLLSCPFLDDTVKHQLISSFKVKGRPLSNQERHDIFVEVPSRQWFTAWLARDSIEVLLEKKRYQTAY